MSVDFHRWTQDGWSQVSLDAAGLVVLADLDMVARRTALTGTSSILDMFVLAPGLHRQQNAVDLNRGEYPACAAMTSGYVFRVENPATVLFLQKASRTGQLTTLSVRSHDDGTVPWLFDLRTSTPVAAAAYFLAVALCIFTIMLVSRAGDRWALLAIGILVLCRAINVVVVRLRARAGWTGAKEPGVKGDLLVLLSQDRWVRVKGLVDDLKTVASGSWFQEATFFQRSLSATATLLVYLDVAVVANAQLRSKLLLLVLLTASAALLGIANEKTNALQMHGKIIEIAKPRQTFRRRLDMADVLIAETGRRDWAIRLGMVQPASEAEEKQEANAGQKIM